MQILSYTPVENPTSAFQGSLSVFLPEYGNIIVSDVAYFVKGDNRWLSWPSKATKDIPKKYIPYFQIQDQKTNRRLLEDLLENFDQWLTQTSAIAPPKIATSSGQKTFDEQIPF